MQGVRDQIQSPYLDVSVFDLRDCRESSSAQNLSVFKTSALLAAISKSAHPKS